MNNKAVTFLLNYDLIFLFQNAFFVLLKLHEIFMVPFQTLMRLVRDSIRTFTSAVIPFPKGELQSVGTKLCSFISWLCLSPSGTVLIHYMPARTVGGWAPMETPRSSFTVLV